MRTKAEVWDIGGVLYEVVDVDPKVLDGDHGDCAYEKGRIRLNKELAPSPREAVKRHELAHGAMWESGARGMLHRVLPIGIAADVEEDLLDRFIPVLMNVRRIK